MTRTHPIRTHQGRTQPLTWDDLPPSARMVLRFCMACTAVVLALLVGLFVMHLMTGAIAAMSDPIGGAPW
jgi:hypothetical protein